MDVYIVYVDSITCLIPAFTASVEFSLEVLCDENTEEWLNLYSFMSYCRDGEEVQLNRPHGHQLNKNGVFKQNLLITIRISQEKTQCPHIQRIKKVILNVLICIWEVLLEKQSIPNAKLYC